MSDLRKAAEAALEAWEWDWSEPRNEALRERMEALRQALSQPEQEPVAWGMQRKDGVIIDVICPEEHAREPGDYTIPLYTAPPKRELVGITYDEVYEFVCTTDSYINLARAIEAKLKEKNT